MDSGSMVAALPCAAERLAGFRIVGLEVLSVLRVGMVVSRASEVYRQTTAVTRPPPENDDTKTRVIGGSGSPL
jgi:hypothetical protein